MQKNCSQVVQYFPSENERQNIFRKSCSLQAKNSKATKNGLLLQSVKVEILCDAVDSLRRNGIFVGGYSKATLWHTLNLRSAAVFPP